MRDRITSLLDKLKDENELPCGPRDRCVQMKHSMGTVTFADEDAADSFKQNWSEAYGNDLRVEYFNASRWKQAVTDVIGGKSRQGTNKEREEKGEVGGFTQPVGKHACRARDASSREVTRARYLTADPTPAQSASQSSLRKAGTTKQDQKGKDNEKEAGKEKNEREQKGGPGGESKGTASSDKKDKWINNVPTQTGNKMVKLPGKGMSRPEDDKENTSPKASTPKTSVSNRGPLGASPMDTGGDKSKSSSSSSNALGIEKAGVALNLSQTVPSLATFKGIDEMDVDPKYKKRWAEEGTSGDAANKRKSIKNDQKRRGTSYVVAYPQP